ncbi:MAG: hypothetical protein KDD82_09550, partial [Planctomycetes bacterium]|nr:hypothetical protein [Planctomycetota bacterium]
MAKPKHNDPTALTPRSNKAKRKRLRARRARALASEAPPAVQEPVCEVLARARRNTRNPARTIQALVGGRLGVGDLPAHSPLRHVAALIADARRQSSACAAAAARLARVSLELLADDPGYRVALQGLIGVRRDWLRAPEAFRCRTRNAGRRFSALLRHLLARYPVPALFDQAWTSGDATHQDWFVRLGRGESLRRVPGLPFPLTKRMAHWVLQAPEGMSVAQALRFGWALGQGARPYVARALLGTRLGGDLPAAQEPFWREVLGFFMRQPMLSPCNYGPIVDYLHAQRFVVPPGASAPPRPQLSMAKREVPALLREV